MAWTVEYAASVRKSVRKLAPEVRTRIRSYLEDRLAFLDDPRQLGTALRGTQFADLWRFRVGNYRIIARLEHARLVILVLAIAHRREVYQSNA
jgi:mRNA interferase RelE/StbE